MNRSMPRNYQIERNAVIQRWYGGNPHPRNPRPHRSWNEGPISPADCFGVPMQVNSPFTPFGYCMVWKYSLNRDGYGILAIDGKQELTHRAAFIQTRGQIAEERQVNHLCNRPYCVQPSHLYAGTTQDNKDDSQIFSKEELLHAPWILLMSDGANTSDPLFQRLQDSSRYDGAEPWEPVEQPAQRPLEEFTCPKHDFAITMFGGASRICRTCEISEFQEKESDDLGIYSLIAEICPVSQTIIPIFEKITTSEFAGESHRETRRKAYHRNRQGLGMGSHDLRTCGCDYCSQDRIAFRAAIQPLLTRNESGLLDVCDRLEPQIATALEEASVDMMEPLARAAAMNDEQVQALRGHHKDCTKTSSELTKASRTLEGELGYLLYAMAEFSTREEMLEDQIFRQLLFRWNLIRMRKEDEEHIRRIIQPAADQTANRIALAWEKETGELMRPYLESKPELHQDTRWLAQALAKKQILEHLRHELLGRNSSGEQDPHPHSSCAASIMETGRVQPFPREFEEGMGYKSSEL